MRISADIYERAAQFGVRLPLDIKRRRRLAIMRQTGVFFVHLPKNGGMSVSEALYGLQVKHASARYYAVAAPDDWPRLPAFSVLRDPVDRFRSAYRYARAGGGEHNQVSPVFRDAYRRLGSVDDALDHIEAARSPFRVDHIFRPQSWYLADRHGRLAVDHLCRIDRLDDLLADIEIHLPAPLPHANRSDGDAVDLRADQIDRLRRLYARDVALFDALEARNGLWIGADD